MNDYAVAIREIKSAILRSRYRAATLANKELLVLYFSVGGYISANSRTDKWGSNAIETIAGQLQKELPGLRGFSATNMKNMRLFYEEWSPFIKLSNESNDSPDKNRQLPTADLKLVCVSRVDSIVQAAPAQFENGEIVQQTVGQIEIAEIVQFQTRQFPDFLNLTTLTNHFQILNNCRRRQKRLKTKWRKQ